MIKKLTVRNFKSFREQSFDLGDSVVLAGPNNAGKTTLLQAVSRGSSPSTAGWPNLKAAVPSGDPASRSPGATSRRPRSGR